MIYQVPAIDQEILDKAGIGAEDLHEHARRTAPQWSVMHRPTTPLSFAERIDATYAAMDALYAELDGLPVNYAEGPNPILELRENPRLLRSAISEVASIQRKLARLPRIITAGNEEPRVAVLAAAYLDAAKSVWNGSALRIYVEAAQQSDPLDLQELWALPTAIKFALLELILSQAAARLHAPQSPEAATPQLLTARIKSLRELGHADWLAQMEPLVVFDAVLQQDPAKAYPRMDFDSREAYRKRVAEIALYSECSELQVAAMALELAGQAHQRKIEDPRVYLRQAHVGYYLIDKGFADLAPRIGYHPRLIDRVRTIVRRNADDFYIDTIEILSVLLIAAIVLPLISRYAGFGGMAFALLLLLLPATQGAVDLVNNSMTALFKAFALPKLDFGKGIPVDYTTLVAVPTLLMNEKQVRELVEDLEVRFLANQDANLHFALLTDLPDSVSRPRENDTNPLVDLAISLINDLNLRYPPSPKHGSFLLLHRHRIFNARQGVWMGWERKRGKLLDLNKYLKAEFDAFPVKAGNVGVLSRVQYIITLDSDTQLPRGTAKSMIGAMAHPLNRAVIDPQRRIVTAGYGILQPRVGVSVHSASRSRLAAIYSGQTGFDVYTRAVSDAYQDLYGDGIFTGKGIYEVSTLHAVLDRRFPRNALLSHDLIEGAYARAGLATDIEVIDDYPSHYSAYTRRKHRWVRGDWQIAQWLFSRVPDESGHYVRNPISTISRWKILDNLRRSVVEIFTLILLVAGWWGLPGGALYWTIVTLLLLFAPTLIQLVFSFARATASEQPGAVQEALLGFWQSVIVTVLNLAFLPHQTMLSLDAIVRSMVRRFVTGQRLLEWETAAEAESGASKTTPVDRYLAATPVFSGAIALITAFLRPDSLFVAGTILILWAFANGISTWLNSPPRKKRQELNAAEDAFLRQHALRIWRFFYEFGGKRHNYLIPDNVEEEKLFEAARVSPTNFGLLLNARQAAVEFGFLTTPEFAELTQNSFAAMAKLPKHLWHLYNWYNTHTFEPLLPITVSSVDSGNLAASLYTLRMGAKSLLHEPLLRPNLFRGIETHWQLLRLQKEVPAELARLTLPSADAHLYEWCEWIFATEQHPVFESIATYSEPSHDEAAWWMNETKARLRNAASFIRNYMPWLLPEYKLLRGMPQLALAQEEVLPTLENSPDFAEQLEHRLARSWATLSTTEANSAQSLLVEQLRLELPPARQRLLDLADSLRAIVNEAYRLAEDMNFAFLVAEGRQLLSIGYELSTKKVHSAVYDMLASEARIATFIAVAKGELSQQGWFKMARTHTMAFDRSILLSWTGTMFEYMMPALWMRTYPDTLISRSLNAVVAIQREFAKQYGIPWGISESGYAQKDDAGHYHYQAFGIPQIALKWDAIAGPVISPYSTFLALEMEPTESLRNLHRMSDNGWVGAYGYYEAADYAESKKTPGLAREWMAHHQGMALLAILNLLHDNVVQDWFHANPQFQATELLLHEKAVPEAALKAEQKVFATKKASKSPALKKAS